MNKFISKISILFFLMLFSVNLSAGDFATANLKAFYGYINSDAPFLKDDTNHYFLEVETIAKKGKWDIYGFSDFKFNKGKVNYDFFKYIVKYDVLDNSKFFIVAEAKETFGGEGFGHKSDAFIGLGTSFIIPLIGNLSINTMYFTATKDALGNKLELPFMLQFAWFNDFGKIGNSNFSLYHGGWSDIDFFEKRKNGNSDIGGNHYSIQAYEGIGVNYETYAVELGYKYWNGMSGNSNSANSAFLYLIKRF